MDPVRMLEVRGPGATKGYVLNGQPVSFGRAADNTVVLDDASVSRYHTRIEWLESQPHVTDLGSANGTLVNDATIVPNVPQRLMPGDNISIVDFQLTLHEPAAGQAERRDVSAQPLPGDKPAMLTRADPAGATLAINTAHWAKSFSIQEETVTVGRDPADDICIDDPVVSWHHAKLEQVAGGYQIVDLGSSNGLTCQDSQVAQMLLADGDELWIAGDVCVTYRITPLAPEAPAAETPAVEEAATEAVQEQAAPLHATMIGTETPSKGLRKIDLGQRTELTIGRSADNDLQLS